MLKVPMKGAGYIAPLKPTLVDEPPAGDSWIHELKHDGYPARPAEVVFMSFETSGLPPLADLNGASASDP